MSEGTTPDVVALARNPFTPGEMVAIRKALTDQPHVYLSVRSNPVARDPATAAAMLVKTLQASGLVVGVETLKEAARS